MQQHLLPKGSVLHNLVRHPAQSLHPRREREKIRTRSHNQRHHGYDCVSFIQTVSISSTLMVSILEALVLRNCLSLDWILFPEVCTAKGKITLQCRMHGCVLCFAWIESRLHERQCLSSLKTHQSVQHVVSFAMQENPNSSWLLTTYPILFRGHQSHHLIPRQIMIYCTLTCGGRWSGRNSSSTVVVAIRCLHGTWRWEKITPHDKKGTASWFTRGSGHRANSISGRIVRKESNRWAHDSLTCMDPDGLSKQILLWKIELQQFFASVLENTYTNTRKQARQPVCTAKIQIEYDQLVKRNLNIVKKWNSLSDLLRTLDSWSMILRPFWMQILVAELGKVQKTAGLSFQFLCNSTHCPHQNRSLNFIAWFRKPNKSWHGYLQTWCAYEGFGKHRTQMCGLRLSQSLSGISRRLVDKPPFSSWRQRPCVFVGFHRHHIRIPQKQPTLENSLLENWWSKTGQVGWSETRQYRTFQIRFKMTTKHQNCLVKQRTFPMQTCDRISKCPCMRKWVDAVQM